MAPPHLHPRSRMTSSLFATTVVASFFVVALPHILPCPAPRRALADGEMPEKRTRRRRKLDVTISEDGIVQFQGQSGENKSTQAAVRECPVPKPGGILGEWLGFHGPKENNKTTPKTER
ncbi:hypothetical protein QBC38DRAFT_246990 [Podospora fimiseda]|uniref:Uncharacterized protein n=1 Tax=Podospora fimiseda TaxID=252190 RepID=A0AAN7BXN2_9PEZI|nr:hypothetical protein QBC38DRAFT_246990 [Podospora fimiseda]